jgi:CheY-like chemotaxis protein
VTLVLIVEDEPLIQAFDEAVLQEAGCHTMTARSFDEVAELLADGHRPDLALIDGNLSDGATGSKVAEIIRAHAPAARLIYTSANSGNEARPALAVTTELLPKPYTHDQLKDIVTDGPAAARRLGTAPVTSPTFARRAK